MASYAAAVSKSQVPRSVSDKEVQAFDSQIDAKLQVSSIPAEIPSSSAPTYAERFKSSLRNLRKISNPTYLEDGTPVVQAPPAVLLQASTLWKDHIVAHFHGRRPHPAKIIADLNPVWGKFGNITVRTVSPTSCLIYVPSVQTREWVLQVGYWQVDHCAFSVFPWSLEGNLQEKELKTAPTWAILRNVPPQLYSLDGISVVASAIGEPLHTEKSRLDPYHFGDTKVKIEITLEAAPPQLVEVRDTEGNAVRIKVDYPSLPPKCINCDKFGHLINRCTQPIIKKKKVLEQVGLSQERMVSTSTEINLQSNMLEVGLELPESQVAKSEVLVEKKKKKKSKRRGRLRSRATEVVESALSKSQIEEKEAPVSLSGDMEALDLAIEGTANFRGKNEFARDKSVVQVVPPKESLSVSELEVSDQEEVVSEPESPGVGIDPDEDERVWFKHPKAVRKALRQNLWKASLLEKTPPKDSSILSRGATSTGISAR